MARYFLLYTVIVLLLGAVLVVNGDDDENKDLVITQRQKMILDRLKKRVAHRLPHDYMKEDVYLIRWLRVNNFDLTSAEEALMENLKWRKEFKMDEIQQEDLSDIRDVCPYYVDTIAKNGQPVFTSWSAQCDTRQLLVTGLEKRMMRYIFQQLDKATIMVREAQQAGKNVTRFLVLANMDGFNLVQHGCPRCTMVLIDFVRQFEKFYPEAIDRIVIINTPSYVRAIFGPIITGAVSRSSSLDSLQIKLLGTDRKEWRPYLLQLIDEKELHEDFGGSRTKHS